MGELQRCAEKMQLGKITMAGYQGKSWQVASVLVVYSHNRWSKNQAKVNTAWDEIPIWDSYPLCSSYSRILDERISKFESSRTIS